MTRETVRVELGDRSYDIHIGRDLIDQAGALLRPLSGTGRVFVVTDETVAALHLPRLKQSLAAAGLGQEAIVLPAGEQSKNFDNLELVLETFLAAGAERNDVIIALGGGVIGDLTGLAAGLLKRGARFVQIPTTLLAQVDSSVGGKTAINTAQGKNLVGLFHQPSLVLADVGLLDTLPERERRAGYAEIVKYAFIDDRDFFDFLETHAADVLAGGPALIEAVKRSCMAKARIVSADERERGQRALLNLGHTFGHALERANAYGPELLHGEAVACGMAMAFRYSGRQGLIANPDDTTRACAHMEAAGLRTRLGALDGGPYIADELLAHMRQDKKVDAGAVTLILTRGIGQAFVQPNADMNDVKAFLEVETNGR